MDRFFYDEHPFDAIDGMSGDEIAKTHHPILKRLVREARAGSLFLDVGCGPGRGVLYISEQGLRCIGVDRSIASLQKMLTRSKSCGILADNSAIPLADGHVDVVISDGVIHHTSDPSQSFKELVRVLKPGGYLYLAIYKPTGKYRTLYKYPGAVIRKIESSGWGRLFVQGVLVPGYYAIHQMRQPGRFSWTASKQMFYDYFITPIVHFIPVQQVKSWAQENGAEVVDYEPTTMNVHIFLLLKCSCLDSLELKTSRSLLPNLQ